jgi:ABC-type lipoprotein export system ATPase subunit
MSSKHCTVLLVTHDSDLAAIADRVVTLDRVGLGGRRGVQLIEISISREMWVGWVTHRDV